ncbi:ABC transporter ATP-binding protein [Mucisphaera calidilacus]|uniref:Putative ABC transporter ATP-binding protein YxlF n=1 Tax=Mucisphaera calidilacus TaxID=2527982 RepID=A0A518C0K5_9BACT|nr:ABC transporter ATP-binding protein [Mucisphaera calidilacus]QDU72758.1 putative ABC transporter ATP-binding protein YxlF [Mucisphaera calidilacus]
MAEAPVSDNQAVIRCLDLTKTFKDFWLRDRVRAVDAIDLDVFRGEVFGLLGPNGSGKSTTIKMILGLLRPTSGQIAVLGKHPEDVSVKRHIGYLPEESYLYRFLTARETLEYYARLFGLNGRQRKTRVDTLLELVGLTHAERRPVGEFSKGMQRKIGLAQALVNDPEILILDEPTTGMDPIATADVKKILLTLKSRGKTVILCSHLLADVESVCDRVSIMFGGRVRAEGPVNELLTDSGKTTLETAHLSESEVQAVEEALRSRGKALDAVRQPRTSLEDLFLDIVKQAEREGLSTSGARSGAEVTGFLAEGAEGGSSADDPDRLIADLVGRQRSEAAEPSDAKRGVEVPPPPGRTDPAMEEATEVLDDLIQQRFEPSAEGGGDASESASEEAKDSDSVDRSLIDDLTQRDKD